MNSEPPCFHCGEPLPPGAPIYARLDAANQPVCCLGCKAVAEFIHDSGLDAFYEYRREPLAEYGLKADGGDWSLYDNPDLRDRYVRRQGGEAEAIVEIGGMYCSACVWLLENGLKREPAIADVSVNPLTKRALLRWDGDVLAFSGLLELIAKIGFKPRPRAAGLDADAASGEQRRSLRRLIVAAAAGMQVMMFAVALYAGDHYGIEGRIEQFLRYVSLIVCLPIISYSARPFFAGAWRGLRAGLPGMDLPVALAISAAFLASMYATFSGRGDIYFDSVAMFVLFLSVTRYLEMRSRHRADDAAEALANMLPESATRLVDGNAEVIALDRLAVNDIVLLRPGDVIPADGEIVTGRCDVDESLITGESMPVHRSAGMTVSAGSINRAGNASMRVTLTGAGTTLAETARLIERAKSDRPAVAILADRIAGRFVTGVLLLSALSGAVWLRLDPDRAFEIVLATLVVTCPCALSLATPAALAASASELARNGFLMVRSRVLEILARRPVIVFDKTGTLTAGRPVIESIEVFRPSLDSETCLRIAAAIESGSEHVLARAFAEAAGAARIDVSDVEVVPGQGVEAQVDGRLWRIGSESFVAGQDTAPSAGDGSRPGASTQVFLGDRDGLVARFDLSDELRPDACGAVRELQALGFELVIASGDRAEAVRHVATRLGIREWHAAMSPTDKLALALALRGRGQPVLMVGDGINDAPVLAAADASIAIDAGTALARASADAVVPGKRLMTVADAARTADRTRRIIRQNVGWAIGYNLAAVPLAVSGMLAPWLAALGMSLSSLVVVMNAMRLREGVPRGADPARSPARDAVRNAAA